MLKIYVEEKILEKGKMINITSGIINEEEFLKYYGEVYFRFLLKDRKVGDALGDNLWFYAEIREVELEVLYTSSMPLFF